MSPKWSVPPAKGGFWTLLAGDGAARAKALHPH
jgi:hypothetical protein